MAWEWGINFLGTFLWQIKKRSAGVLLGSLYFIPFQVGKIPCFKALFSYIFSVGWITL
jgi:hypothetical protein